MSMVPSSRAVVLAQGDTASGDEDEWVGRRVLVAGATGMQGGAVVRHLLRLQFNVVAMTRTPDTARAHALTGAGAVVVKGDMDDPLSLDRALALASGAQPGCHPHPGALYGVFAVQNYWHPTPSLEREVQQGTNLVDAAKRASVRHFIYSSMGSCTQEAGPWSRRGGTGIPQFESKRRLEEHLKQSGVPFTILRPAFFIDHFWNSNTPWAHPTSQIVMPARQGTVQQMVWSDDIGAMAAKAFQQGGGWLGRELEVAGDELTGPQIAAVFSIVTRRPMKYKRGPPMPLLRLFSREGYMHSTFIDEVGCCAHLGECRKLLPSIHTLEQALRANGWEDRPSAGFGQSLCSCHTPDMWLRTACCPCCTAAWIAKSTRGTEETEEEDETGTADAFLCCVASICAFPCVTAQLRGSARLRYGIIGSCPLDYCIALCCPPCAMVQQAAEVRLRKSPLVPQKMDRGGGAHRYRQDQLRLKP